MEALNFTVKKVLKPGAVGFGAVKRLVPCQVEKRPPRHGFHVYHCPPQANVETTRTASYRALMSELLK